MSRPTLDGGIADDASHYEHGDEPPALASHSASGIASDASFFDSLLVETTDELRSLESDWLYERDGRVFGPVKPRVLLEMLYLGEIGETTPISPDEREFVPLRRVGAFAAHLERAKRHLEEVAEQKRAEEVARKAVLRRRVRVAIFLAIAVAAAAAGISSWVRGEKESRARAEKARMEDALRRETEALLARGLTIEPPLLPLVEDTPGGRKSGRERAGGSGSRRAVARFSGTGELGREEIMAGVSQAFGGFKQCIAAQIGRDSASVPEQIVIAFSIANDGSARSIEIGDRGMRTSLLAGCMAGELSKLRWRKFVGEVQNIEYPITIHRP